MQFIRIFFLDYLVKFFCFTFSIVKSFGSTTLVRDSYIRIVRDPYSACGYGTINRSDADQGADLDLKI
jgi:hypothetical protein